jgi:hypothetical protein
VWVVFLGEILLVVGTILIWLQPFPNKIITYATTKTSLILGL